MSNEQFEGHSAEIYAGAGNAPENAHVDAAEDGGEIDGTVEPTSDDSVDDWGLEGKKRKLTREVLVGFAAIGVLVAVFAVVVGVAAGSLFHRPRDGTSGSRAWGSSGSARCLTATTLRLVVVLD